MRLTWPLLVGLAVLPCLLQPSYADGFHGERRHPWHFHIGDDHWRHGHWVQSWHGGRYGWWWLVGGTWLLYNTPIYPYPVTAPIVIMEPPPQTYAAPGALPPPAPIWYYCQQPQGYYPYLPSCPSGWQAISSVPPDLHP